MLDSFTEATIANYRKARTDSITARDKAILRELALQVAELAARPIEDEKRKLWYDHNELKPTRPLITMEAEDSWNELIPRSEIICESFMARLWEEDLRRLIYSATYLKDDRVVEPVIYIPYLYSEFDFGLKTKIISTGAAHGAYTWDPPLKDYATDFNKLKFPELDVDIEKTMEIVGAAREVFKDLIEIKVRGIWWWTLGLTWRLVTLRGLENVMLDMYDYPIEFHATMSFLSDAYAYLIDQIEKKNLFTLNNDGTYLGSGGFGYSRELPAPGFNGHVHTSDMWGFGESQETVSVSPEMFEEFIFPYQRKLLSRFGLVYYGCCEPLNKRWHLIKTIPGIRRLSISPWSDMEDMAQKLGGDYIYSMKASPMTIAVPKIDEEFIRKGLRHAMQATKNCRVEITMQDTITICNNPNNAINWCRIAMEESKNL